MKGIVTASSQPERLRDRMAQAGLRHGETVRADIRGVRVLAPGNPALFHRLRGNRAEVRFCYIDPLVVHERLQKGDDAPLPDQAKVENLRFNDEGEYDLIGAIVHSNGRMIVRADRYTTIQRHVDEEELVSA